MPYCIFPRRCTPCTPVQTWLRGEYICINLFETQIFETSGGRLYANYACAHRNRKKNVAFMAIADQSYWWYFHDPAANAIYNIHVREMVVGVNVPQGVASTATVRSLPIPQCIYPINCVRTPSTHLSSIFFPFYSGKARFTCTEATFCAHICGPCATTCCCRRGPIEQGRPPGNGCNGVHARSPGSY